MAQGWSPGAGEQPLPPINGQALSPFVQGVIDIRWDDPSILAGNSPFHVVGVNIYRSDVSDRGPFHRINQTPIGGSFYRDRSDNVLVREVVLWDRWVFQGNAPNSREWMFRTQQPINKRISGAPFQKPTPGDSPLDVILTIDGVEVPVHSVFGPTGDVVLVNQPGFDTATEMTIPAALPTANSTVEIQYYTNRNFIRSGLGAFLTYRLTTVVLDSTTPSGYRETDLNYCPPVITSAVETMDYIWREAVRRNSWILQQGGERVKIFIRKQAGIPCDCKLDPRTRAFARQASQRCHVCFPPGTEITLDDFTRKPIETVQIGDAVLTHTGRVRCVSGTMSRDVDETLVELKATHGVGFSATANHPVLVVRRENARCQRLKNCLCTGQLSKKICSGKPWRHPCSFDPQTKTQWVPASEVQKGDYLVFRLPEKTSGLKEMSPERLRVLGYYAAEGWTAKKQRQNGSWTEDAKSTWFGFHIAEIPTFIAELQGCLRKEYGAASSVQPCSNSDKGCSVAVSKQAVAQDMIRHAGRYSRHKRLSQELVWQNAEASREFLGAYFNGDGWQCLNSNRTHLGISTASYNLARQIEMMLLRQGIVPRFDRRLRKGLRNIDRPGTHDTIVHTVAVRKTDMHVLAKTMQKMRDIRSERSCSGWAVSVGNLVLYPVRNKLRVPYVGKVYNLEVAEDHTYVANGAVVHNCFGSGYIGGYEGGYDAIVAPDDAERRISQGPNGRRQEHTYEVWTGPTPMVTQRDLVVKQTNERYSIGPVRRPSNRGNLLQQHFNIAYLDEGDIRYLIPIDGTTDYPWPETRYSHRPIPGTPIDGALPDEPLYPVGPDAQLPMETNRTDVPPAKQPRGRSPAWSNQNWGLLLAALPLWEMLHGILRTL